jgi:hypothetical protein
LQFTAPPLALSTPPGARRENPATAAQCLLPEWRTLDNSRRWSR